MHQTTRAFFAVSLLALVSAAGLHAVVLAGAGAEWAALVHLTLFGWISGMIYAVNYHTMPVFTARDFPDRRIGRLHLISFGLGAALAPAGLLLGAPALVTLGLGLELAAALLFVVNVALLLTRGPRRRRPPPPPPVPGQREVDKIATRATALAGICLPLALALLLGVRLRLIGGQWWLASEHLAALGWAMLMIVGVAYHVLPRFSGRATRGAAWARAQLGLQLLGLALVLAGLGTGQTLLFAAGGLITAGATAVFAWTVWPTLRPLVARPTLIQVSTREQAS